MHYEKHIFICTNQRPDGKACCANHDAATACHQLKMATKLRGIDGPGKIRVSQSGCLGRCELGPVAVVYPAGHWYTYNSLDDLDEILEEDLIKGGKVEHLLLP
ncbi:MAG: (2Fe-2S) ferredoxin domain-containing protein [Gammaproteobacteria bacterium]|nr:(2Fe-2S) ferredoxin domain-containing protein [Gammaproteobacteria bacterium]